MLSHDIARCTGTTAEMCQWCRRREPGREEWQWYDEPKWKDGQCENYIPPSVAIVTTTTTA